MGIVHLCTGMYNSFMKTVSFTDFRKNASTLIDLVEQGEEVEIHRHGKVVARLVPPGVAKAEASWRKPGLKLVTKAPSLSDAIIEGRR
jgi:prevent-host-death family protein